MSKNEDDEDFQDGELSGVEIRKYLYLFHIDVTKLLTEFSKWKSMSNEEKEDYENDFSWYLGSKYFGKVD